MHTEGTNIVLFTRNPEKVTTAIPTSRMTGEQNGVYRLHVNWGLDEARVLTNIGFRNVPSPMYRTYDWPGPFSPFEHQRHTAGFLTLNTRAFCFNEMGCGKTASVVWAADYLMRLGRIKRVLVICPVSIMQSPWDHEWFRLSPTRHVAVAYGSAEKRRAAITGPAEVVVINHDGIKFYLNELMKGDFDCIVIDECNAYKNTSSDRWKALNQLASPGKLVWMMTGTPASQSPLDAYGLAKIVNPKKVPRSRHLWQEQVMRKLNQFKWVPMSNAREQVFAALQPAIRYHKKDCLDLPPVTYETRTVTLTPQQKKYYKLLAKELLLQVAGATITAATAAVKMIKLLQIACGAVKTDDANEVMQFDCSSRINVVMELIEETDNKVLVAVPFINAMHILHAALAKEYGDDAVACIYGDVPMQERTRLIREFQDGDTLRIMLIQPAAAAHGITLTRADTVVWFSPPTSYEYFAQLNARIDRPGQVNAMTVVQLEGCPVEVQLNTALRERKLNNEALLDMLGRLT
jgi:SNF2 family DNA or RNA helicase